MKVPRSEDLMTPRDPAISNSNRRFAPITVTREEGRFSITPFKAKLCGKKWYKPIVTWVCIVKSGTHCQSTQYSERNIDEFSLWGKYNIMQSYFMRISPCVLAENFSTVHAFAKGTKGV